MEAWVREAHGWAYVDPLAGDIAGPMAMVHPDAWPLIDAWAADGDFWVRRSALLTLLPAIRRGGLDHERFERYAHIPPSSRTRFSVVFVKIQTIQRVISPFA